MPKKNLLLFIICAIGLFFMAELTACRTPKGLGCPTNLGKTTIPSTINQLPQRS